MSGPVVVMASSFTDSSFPRSSSSSNLPDLASPDFAHDLSDAFAELPRSASFTYLPTLEETFPPPLEEITAFSADFLPIDGESPSYDDRSTETEDRSSSDKPKSQDSPPTSRSASPDTSPNRTPKDSPANSRRPSLRTFSLGRARSKSRGRTKAAEERRQSILDAPTKTNSAENVSIESRKLERTGRQRSFARPKSWIQRKPSSPERRRSPERKLEKRYPNSPAPAPAKTARDRSKSRQSTLVSLARKSWISPSRSPSPDRRRRGRQEKEEEATQTSALHKESTSGQLPLGKTASVKSSPVKPLKLTKAEPVTRPAPPSNAATAPAPGPAPTPVDTSEKKRSRSLSRRSTLLIGKYRRQSTLGMTIDLPPIPPTPKSPGGPKSPSILGDSYFTPRTSTDVPPVPKMFALDRLQSLGETRRKDELWSAFRALETDFQKFQSKSSALKTNVVRATLLPFLRTHAQHPSNKHLRPEDIDRRVNVLNKWWVGLLEMLDGHNGQAVSGVDRPVLLDAITGIMTRPEWQLSPSYFAPVLNRSGHGTPKSASSISLSSNSSFLAESVYHNVRNLFVQNLLLQMTMVVERMSLRHAPASLVTFCGKAAAYAFFFCPGVADALIRIWSISPENLRRVVDEFGLSRRPDSAASDSVLPAFPQYLHNLAYTSFRSLKAELRRKPNLPLGAAQIPWKAPWVGRFRGRDSDLFFVFCKHYHILVEDLVPPNLSFAEKARAPGFVLVQAQILAVLDQTIHRSGAGEMPNAPPPLTFDDVLLSAEASAAALPLPSSNVTRLMAENRLIMLLRDFISERPSDHLDARQTFARSFCSLMVATAKKISLYDHVACFVLCDFVEEALFIYTRYQHTNPAAAEYVDWGFWLEVCKRMLSSQNTMSEIRLISFIYSIWSTVTADNHRKEVLALRWLLSEEVFMTLFNHWSPMVRAYYMRLLCWRLCRFSEDASEVDLEIYKLVTERLNTVWANYLYVRHTAEREKKLLPSIMPCPPAPGRRILIIRNDNQTPPTGLFLGFDGLMAPRMPPNAAPKRHSLAGLGKIEQNESKARTESAAPAMNNKKRWSILGKMNPFGAVETPKTGATGDLDTVRKETADARNGKSSDGAPEHRPFSFKFSLEWNPPPQNTVRRSRPIQFSPPRLPCPSQNYLVANVPGITEEIPPKKPHGNLILRAKYAGRALAEWGFVVHECNNFVDRRKAEGVPSLKLMEVPTLSVEGIRKFGN